MWRSLRNLVLALPICPSDWPFNFANQEELFCTSIENFRSWLHNVEKPRNRLNANASKIVVVKDGSFSTGSRQEMDGSPSSYCYDLDMSGRISYNTKDMDGWVTSDGNKMKG